MQLLQSFFIWIRRIVLPYPTWYCLTKTEAGWKWESFSRWRGGDWTWRECPFPICSVQFRKAMSWFIVIVQGSAEHIALNTRNEKIEMLGKKELTQNWRIFLAATRGVGKERRRTWQEADIYEFIYFDLTRSLAFRRRERVADCYPFQTSVFGTKIQLTLQLITVARFEGTARVKLKIDLHGWFQRKLVVLRDHTFT